MTKIYVKWGNPIKGELTPLPATYGKPAKDYYEIHAKIKNVDKEKLKENFPVIVKELKKHGVKLQYFEITKYKDGTYAIMQIKNEGLQSFSPLITALPSILKIAGITITAISLYKLLSENKWKLMGLIIGLLLLMYGGTILSGDSNA